MQRRVKQADADRLTLHDPENLFEVIDLHRDEPFKRRCPALGSLGKDHLAHDRQTVCVEEHMFGPAESDPFGHEGPGNLRLCRSVTIRANADIARIICPAEKCLERVIERRFKEPRCAREQCTLGAIECDSVTFGQGLTISQRQGLGLATDRDPLSPNDTWQTKSAGNHRRVAGHAAPFGHDRNRGMHSANVPGGRLASDQDAGFSACGISLSGRGVEHQFSRSSTRAGGDPVGQNLTRRLRINLLMEHLGEPHGLDPQDGLILRNYACLSETYGDPDCGTSASWNAHRIDDGQVPTVERKLDLHLFAEVLAADVSQRHYFGKRAWCDILERRASRVARQIDGTWIVAQSFAALRLAQIASGDLRLTRHRRDEFDHTRPGFGRAETRRHRLYNKT